MSPTTLLAVAAGGAIGAVGRYLVVSLAGTVFGLGFPYGTIIVNIVGSFVLGILVETGALVWSPSPELRALLVVGMLGAFTTFSTFSLDVVVLFERKAYMPAAIYLAVSVVASIAALAVAMRLTRMVLV